MVEAKNMGILTCPQCGHQQPMEIPQLSCIPFYRCEGCGNLVAARNSCCVFCDYADRPCPVGPHGS
jgi:hypothetical protein